MKVEILTNPECGCKFATVFGAPSGTYPNVPGNWTRINRSKQFYSMCEKHANKLEAAMFPK